MPTGILELQLLNLVRHIEHVHDYVYDHDNDKEWCLARHIERVYYDALHHLFTN